MPTLFTKIIQGEIPCYKIAEDDNHIAFLDINPNAKGHTLCVPKQEADKVFDMSDEAYLNLFAFAKKIAAAMEKAVPCKRVGISVVGLEVPHTHIHLIPLNTMDDMRFIKKETLSEKEFLSIAEAIKSNLS